ncbi:MAG: hypothetical protein Q9171_006662 [Xanthocarpia ochracea]
MNRFDIQPLNRFVTGESASIRRPREIASFSYDDAHEFHLDERSLRYYYPPRIGADLSKGKPNSGALLLRKLHMSGLKTYVVQRLNAVFQTPSSFLETCLKDAMIWTG